MTGLAWFWAAWLVFVLVVVARCNRAWIRARVLTVLLVLGLIEDRELEGGE